MNRRKVSIAMAVDRRKSYLDVMERVLDTSQWPESLPPAVRDKLRAFAPGAFGAPPNIGTPRNR
jgi:hypothetical protein